MALLRVSGEALGGGIDAQGVSDGAGVVGGSELVAFATAAVGRTSDLATTRAALRRAVGTEGLVEAAATVSVFEGLNRIADATGIQLDESLAADTVELRANLGIDGYAVTEGKAGQVDGPEQRAGSVLGLFQ